MQGKSLVLKNTHHKLYNLCKLHTQKFIQLQDIKMDLERTKQAVVMGRARQKSHRNTSPNYNRATG